MPATLVVLALLIGFVLGLVSRSPIAGLVNSAGTRNLSAPSSFAEVVSEVNPSVVSVTSTKIIDLNQAHDGFEFWSLRPEDEGLHKSRGFGSGFVLREDGIIVTNDHVIDDARQLTVRLLSGEEYPARVLGTDSETDLALIKIESRNGLQPVRLGNSDEVRVGDWVMAVGNPYNYEHSVTVGVVSAKDRRMEDNPFESYIQTDAAINFGNSGGPLFNSQGEVVAINSAISTRGRSIGFAIPINLAKNIFRQLERQGRVVRGFLGVKPVEVNAEHVKVLQLPQPRGVLIAEVSPNSAAESAGIRLYDVITEIDGQAVQDREDFFQKVAQTRPGTTIKLKGFRDREAVEFAAVVRERQPLSQARSTRPDPPEVPGGSSGTSVDAGIAVQDLTDQQRRLHRIESEPKGVLVTQVLGLSPAADAGLAAGDIILEVNRQPVKSRAEFQRMLSQLRSSGALMMLVLRPKQEYRIVTLRLERLE
ncbi:MAG: Do family serine endopeptidase [Acidobacteriota bacterium]